MNISFLTSNTTLDYFILFLVGDGLELVKAISLVAE